MDCTNWCNNSQDRSYEAPSDHGVEREVYTQVREPLEKTEAPRAEEAKPPQAEVKHAVAEEIKGAAPPPQVVEESVAPRDPQGGAAPAASERVIALKAGLGANENVTPPSLNQQMGGKPNFLRTTQFTPVTWLPKSLFNQFKRLANVYFLIIAIVVVVGTVFEFTPKDWRSKIGPFVFVLLWTALKDLFEDLRRRKDDRLENMKTVKKYNPNTGNMEDTYWSDVLVGDLLYIGADEAFPADLVLLKSAENETSFISTVMLDGETSLKERSMPKVLTDVAESVSAADIDKSWPENQRECLGFAKKMVSGGAEVKMGAPSAVLSDIRGFIEVQGGRASAPLSENNYLPRGCILRNTAFVFALSVYVGPDTKTRLNATQANLKFSQMQKALNVCIRVLLVFIVGVSLFAAIMSELKLFGDEEAPFEVYVMFFRFSIAFYHAVPMSLYVVYEMLKLMLGFQVNKDQQMFYDGEGAVARTADLMEEMGQVDFIFSDKTGTLTANEMVFARSHVEGKDMGDFRRIDGKDPEGVLAAKNIMAQGGSRAEAVGWYFMCLATCHEVVLEMKQDEQAQPTYTGMSPDEVALVTAAREAGVVFMRRNRLPGGVNEIEVKDNAGKISKFEVLSLLQFTSDRKRMSVVIKSSEGGAWCITKGADVVIEPLIQGGFPDAAKSDILKFSKTGLRVLVIGSKKLDDDFLQSWLIDYQKARGILDDTKDERIREVVARMENGLTFVGLTAVEDRLQDGVPEAIETVKKAGSRVWVLTGDKTETAVNIAYSCALFTETTKLAYCVEKANVAEAALGFTRAKVEIEGEADAGLVIDGGTLIAALSDEACRKMIFELGMASRSCICTRLSPMQKLQLVQLVRAADAKRITLTIGDGANDVPMILGGHVGVGIRGKEGAAAVQVCDVAISQFRFLVPLLLCHGRRAYRRVSVFFCYYLYKNFVLLMADLVWMFWDNFQGNIAFPEYLSIAFNAFFTSWHIWFVMGWDKDVPDEVACAHPELYKAGPENRLFNTRIFLKWMVYAILHGCVAWLVPFLMIGTQDWESKQFWVSSSCAFTNVVHISLLKLVIVAENPFSMATLLPTFGAWLMFVSYLAGIGYTPLGHSVQPNMKNVPGEILKQGDAMLSLVLGVVIALSLDVAERLGQRYFFPSELQQAEFAMKAARKEEKK